MVEEVEAAAAAVEIRDIMKRVVVEVAVVEVEESLRLHLIIIPAFLMSLLVLEDRMVMVVLLGLLVQMLKPVNLEKTVVYLKLFIMRITQ
jgi:hypothetical protein